MNEDILIFRFLSGESSSEENSIFKSKLESDSVFRKQFEDLREIWLTSGTYFNSDDFQVEEAINNFKKRTKLEYRHIVRNKILKYSCIAAAIFILLFVGNQLYFQSEIPDEIITLVAPDNELLELTLPDQTKVWLNNGAILSYCKNKFDDKKRLVNLNGEAYFDVTRNTHKPFEVVSDRHHVKVLGTKFNVRAIKNEDIIETVLEEGSVNVYTADNSINCILKPGERTVFNKITNRLSKQSANIEISTAWKKSLLKFKNETFESLAPRLEKWYKLKIILGDEKVKQLRYTGTIENESFDQLIKILSLSHKLHASKDGNTVTITLKSN